MKSKILTIYTDAGYSLGSKTGRIAYKLGNRKVKVERVKIPIISYLKQYTNLLELEAVAKALERARNKKILVYTDSRNTVAWVKRKNNNLTKFSDFHWAVKERIDTIVGRLDYFDIKWVSREQNPAGWALEKTEMSRVVDSREQPESEKMADYLWKQGIKNLEQLKRVLKKVSGDDGLESSGKT